MYRIMKLFGPAGLRDVVAGSSVIVKGCVSKVLQDKQYKHVFRLQKLTYKTLKQLAHYYLAHYYLMAEHRAPGNYMENSLFGFDSLNCPVLGSRLLAPRKTNC